jgi:hypothetical protein
MSGLNEYVEKYFESLKGILMDWHFHPNNIMTKTGKTLYFIVCALAIYPFLSQKMGQCWA